MFKRYNVTINNKKTVVMRCGKMEKNKEIKIKIRQRNNTTCKRKTRILRFNNSRK